MFLNIIWGLVLTFITSIFIYKDRKKKKSNRNKHDTYTNKDLEKEKAIEKEKARTGFAQSPGGGGGDV